MQKVWEVLDEDTGAVKISLLADTTANGITISNSPNWQTPIDIEHIVSLLNIAAMWLQNNAGTQ
jgi:hypothetical protein